MILIPFFVLLLGVVVWMSITIILGTQIGNLMTELIKELKEEKPKKEKIKGDKRQ